MKSAESPCYVCNRETRLHAFQSDLQTIWDTAYNSSPDSSHKQQQCFLEHNAAASREEYATAVSHPFLCSPAAPESWTKPSTASTITFQIPKHQQLREGWEKLPPFTAEPRNCLHEDSHVPDCSEAPKARSISIMGWLSAFLPLVKQ